jgi:hypothetical protein
MPTNKTISKTNTANSANATNQIVFINGPMSLPCCHGVVFTCLLTYLRVSVSYYKAVAIIEATDVPKKQIGRHAWI